MGEGKTNEVVIGAPEPRPRLTEPAPAPVVASSTPYATTDENAVWQHLGHILMG